LTELLHLDLKLTIPVTGSTDGTTVKPITR